MEAHLVKKTYGKIHNTYKNMLKQLSYCYFAPPHWPSHAKSTGVPWVLSFILPFTTFLAASHCAYKLWLSMWAADSGGICLHVDLSGLWGMGCWFTFEPWFRMYSLKCPLACLLTSLQTYSSLSHWNVSHNNLKLMLPWHHSPYSHVVWLCVFSMMLCFFDV